MNQLEYRRQFLLSSKKCSQLNHWNKEILGSYFLYVHQDCQILKVFSNSNEVCLIGYFFDPNEGSKTELEILEELVGEKSVDALSSRLYPLVGRFALVVKLEEEYFVFNDSCGLRSVCSYDSNEGFYLASQPTLFKLVTALTEGEKYETYFNSKYVKSNKEHWIPAGCSLYDNVTQLVPNHFLNFKSNRQVRFWPKRKVHKIDSKSAELKFSEILRNTMVIASERFNLALAVTAGWDSRLLLSACKEIANDIDFYTLQYRDMSEKSTDIKISNELLNSFGYSNQVYDCRGFNDLEFLEIYERNSGVPHVNDWGNIANGIFHHFKSTSIAVKGNCTEIGRCYYYENGKHPWNVLHTDLLNLEFNWNTVNFIPKEIEKWHNEASEVSSVYGYKELDLFYWEQRMGSWQAQSQLEWDIAQEVFTPFNNRELIDVMLSVDESHRCGPNYDFFKNTIEMLWPEVLEISINPKSQSEKLRNKVRLILKKTKVLTILKQLVKG